MASGSWANMTEKAKQDRREAIQRGAQRYQDSLTEKERVERYQHSLGCPAAVAARSSLECHLRRSKAAERYWATLDIERWLEVCKSHSEGIKGYVDSLSLEEKTRRASKISRGVKRYYATLDASEREQINAKRSETMKRLWDNLEPEKRRAWLQSWIHNEKVYSYKRRRWASLSNEEKNRRAKKIMDANRVSPSEPEIRLGALLEKHHPGTWAYNGRYGQGIAIGGKVPASVRRDGIKQVIEVFGQYWHDENEAVQRKQYFRSYGYDCVIVWDYECYLWDEELSIKIGRRVLV